MMYKQSYGFMSKDLLNQKVGKADPNLEVSLNFRKRSYEELLKKIEKLTKLRGNFFFSLNNQNTCCDY